MPAGFELPTSDEITRLRPLRRLAEPWYERRHLYSSYAAFLDRLDPARFEVVPLREFSREQPEGRIRLGLRHDVDDRLDSALEFARLEHERGLRATYFVLHSARYYTDDDVIPALRRLQDLGHEVGFHYDLVTLQVAHGIEPRDYLARELARLRSAGVDIVGVAAHGSFWGEKLGYKNYYFFHDLATAEPGFPNVDRVGAVMLAKGTLGEFGLEYDASQLSDDAGPGGGYRWTDSWFDVSGRRWHTDLADLDSLQLGECAIALIHSCHWDRSLAGKYTRTLRRLAGRLVEEVAGRLRGQPERRAIPSP